MNNKRRAALQEASGFLDRAVFIIEGVLDGEQDAMDNCPENLQGSERFEAMEAAVDALNDAVERIEEARESVSTAIK